MDEKRPYDSLRLQISKVPGMLDIASRFSEAVSADHLLSLIVKETLDLMGAEVCIVWLKDDNSKLVARISFGLKGPAIRSVKLEMDQRIVRCITEKKVPVYIANLTEDPRVPFKKIIRSEGLKSMLAAPLVVGDDLIGIMMLCTKKPRRFHDTDIKIFNAIARQSALAVADIGLYDRMDKKAKDKMKKISMLFEMSKSFSSEIELKIVLDTIIEKARVILGAKLCVLKLLDNSRRRLNVAASCGFGAKKKTIPAKCHVLEVPLFSNKRKAGSLSFYGPAGRIFDREDRDMAEMVAGFLSIVVDNSTMLERIRKDYLNTIKTLARIIDANDPYTRGHCEKVKKYSMIICKEMKLHPKHVNAIKAASLLHDIGKIAIDTSVLRKTEKLTEEDWQKIRMHPEVGARIISQVGFMNEVVPIVKYHHSRFSGGGYPDPEKSGNKIPIGARVLAVADAYDAMTSDRPYRKAMSKEEALNEIKRCAGEQFDPEVVGALLCKEL